MEPTDEKTLNANVESACDDSSEVVRINFDHLKKDLSGFVRGTVEDALNGLLDAEAQRLCQARRYERTERRSAHRNGYYERGLETAAVNMTLKVPKLRRSVR